LRRSDLGAQYPKQNFETRIPKLLATADICITARNDDGLLIGVCLGVTDFAYFLFLTDLGVDRAFVRQGIGRELVRRAHNAAGGPVDITIMTCSNNDALAFYKACKMLPAPELVVKYCTDWEPFVVQ
jgi:ribosomal protein S18 acetylase RimI-like enzyme